MTDQKDQDNELEKLVDWIIPHNYKEDKDESLIDWTKVKLPIYEEYKKSDAEIVDDFRWNLRSKMFLDEKDTEIEKKDHDWRDNDCIRPLTPDGIIEFKRFEMEMLNDIEKQKIKSAVNRLSPESCLFLWVKPYGFRFPQTIRIERNDEGIYVVIQEGCEEVYCTLSIDEVLSAVKHYEKLIAIWEED